MLEIEREIPERPKYYRIPQSKGPDGERQLGKPIPVYGEDLRKTQIQLSNTRESNLNSQPSEVTIFE